MSAGDDQLASALAAIASALAADPATQQLANAINTGDMREISQAAKDLAQAAGGHERPGQAARGQVLRDAANRAGRSLAERGRANCPMPPTRCSRRPAAMASASASRSTRTTAGQTGQAQQTANAPERQRRGARCAESVQQTTPPRRANASGPRASSKAAATRSNARSAGRRVARAAPQSGRSLVECPGQPGRERRQNGDPVGPGSGSQGQSGDGADASGAGIARRRRGQRRGQWPGWRLLDRRPNQNKSGAE